MNSVPTYEELFGRNIGVFTPSQQERVRSLRVAIAGCGGIGSPVAVCLARLGVGEIRLADPEAFEPSNINRQFGAYVDTVGQNKSRVLAEEVKRINPHAVVVCDEGGITAETCERFTSGVDCVVNALDFYATQVERVLYEVARRNGQWVFTGLQAGTVCVFTSFSPESASYEELFCPDGKVDVGRMLRMYFPVRPPELTEGFVNSILSGEELVLPFVSTATMVAGGLLAEGILRRFVWDKLPVVAPRVLVLELSECRLQEHEGTTSHA